MAKRKSRKEKEAKIKKVGRMKKPDHLTLAQWQIQLRRQFAEKQAFSLVNNGGHKLYSDFTVINPTSGNSYKVALRQLEPGANYCSCQDYRTNTLGTCKHIEWAIHHLRNAYGTKKYFAAPPPERTYSSVYVHYGDRPSVRIRFGEDQKRAYMDLARDHFDATGVIKENGILRFDSFLKKAKALNEEFRCYDDVLEWILKERANLTRIAKLEDYERDPNSLDGLIRANLFSYQRTGVLFAAKAGRTLIADEMGLGKTIQAIATAELLKKEMGISRTIIICPTSLKYQWKAEIEKFTDSTVLVLEGNPLKREKVYESYQSFYLIMTYNIVRRDLDKLNALDADLVILDEAQRIKNWETKIAKAVKKLTMPNCIVLTGTPLENKLEELYSIVQFVDPYILSPLFGLLDRHQVKDGSGKITGYKELNTINKKLKSVMIRRLKKKVIKQMPTRQDKVLLVPMTAMQNKLHSEYQEQVAKLVNKWHRFGYLNEQDRQKLMICMNMMRMSCDSTYIIDLQTRHDTKVDELMDILEEKLEDPREKVVVFSQWKRMTHLVELELEEKGIGFVHLNGSVPSKNRGQLLDTFRDDLDCRVFLSTDAGGVGLNLQSASMVINLDIPWNPAVLEQRIARVHRLGQKNKVQVINLVSIGTIEHKMLDVLAFKSGLAEGILDEGDDSIFMEDSKFKKFMESVEVLTADAPANEEDGDESVSTVPEEIPVVERDEIEEKLPDDALKPLPKEDDWKDEGEKEPAEGVDYHRGPRRKRIGEVTPPTPEPITSEAGSPQDLVQMGMNFFSGLTQTLADPVATEKLINSITETDEKTGQSYLKIPVQGKEVVQNAFKVISALFQQK